MTRPDLLAGTLRRTSIIAAVVVGMVPVPRVSMGQATSFMTYYGMAFQLDGVSPVDTGYTVRIANNTRGVAYVATPGERQPGAWQQVVLATDNQVVAASGEEIEVSLLDSGGNAVGVARHVLVPADIAAHRVRIDVQDLGTVPVGLVSATVTAGYGSIDVRFELIRSLEHARVRVLRRRTREWRVPAASLTRDGRIWHMEDADVEPGVRYEYAAEVRDPRGTEWFLLGASAARSPSLQLSSSPNPFRREATIRFSLASRSRIDISVFDVGGRIVRHLVRASTYGAGEYEVVWYGRDDRGERLPRGVYFCRLRSRDGFRVRRMVLLR